MEGAIHDAIEEIKRVDHMIYVSLKYTRTVDVIRNIVSRLIECYKIVLDELLNKLDLYEIPSAPMLRMRIIKENYDDKKLHEYIDFYAYLRKIYNSDFSRSGEFRKGVKMTVYTVGEPIEIDTIKISEFYQKTKDFLHYIQDNY